MEPLQRIGLFHLVAVLYGVGSLVGCCDAFKFALVPKSIDNIFFDVSRDGCIDRAQALSASEDFPEIECIYTGPTIENRDVYGVEQARMVDELIEGGEIDGLSISITYAETMRPMIKKAMERNIPVVTFDSDDPESGRSSYIGTDNFFLGEQLGKVLKQIQPEGGTYAIVTNTSPNIVERELGVRSTLDKVTDSVPSVWKEVEGPPLDMLGNNTYAIELMRELAQRTDVTAIIPVMGGPMFLSDLWSDLVAEFPEVIFVVGDGLAVQLELMARAKVQGLVAQLPYEMGVISVDTLLTLSTLQVTGQSSTIPDFQGTNVLEHVQVPLVLPELIVNQNHLGLLSILGFTLAGIVTCTGLGFVVWAIKKRNVRVVAVAQPPLLCMVSIGVIIMGTSLIPLSFDDSSEDYTPRKGQIQCMSVPWLGFLGFTTAFAALFAKLHRINSMINSAATSMGETNRAKKSQVNTKDVVLPLVVLLSANAITLFVWTFVDPLKYTRVNAEGVDPWNRIIATYGQCTMERPWPYVSVLGTLNIGVLIIAIVEAYRARKIASELAEAKHFGIALLSMLQVSLLGIPLMAVVRDDPQAYYLTLCLLVFIVCMVVLLVIFIPRIVHARQYENKSNTSQRKMISQAVKESMNPTRDSSRDSKRSSNGHFATQETDEAVIKKLVSQALEESLGYARDSAVPTDTESNDPRRRISSGDEELIKKISNVVQESLDQTRRSLSEHFSDESGNDQTTKISNTAFDLPDISELSVSDEFMVNQRRSRVVGLASIEEETSLRFGRGGDGKPLGEDQAPLRPDRAESQFEESSKSFALSFGSSAREDSSKSFGPSIRTLSTVTSNESSFVAPPLWKETKFQGGQPDSKSPSAPARRVSVEDQAPLRQDHAPLRPDRVESQFEESSRTIDAGFGGEDTSKSIGRTSVAATSSGGSSSGATRDGQSFGTSISSISTNQLLSTTIAGLPPQMMSQGGSRTSFGSMLSNQSSVVPPPVQKETKFEGSSPNKNTAPSAPSRRESVQDPNDSFLLAGNLSTGSLLNPPKTQSPPPPIE